MARISVVLRSKPNKDKKHSIFVSYYHAGKQKRFAVGEKVLPSHFVDEYIIGDPESEYINDRIELKVDEIKEAKKKCAKDRVHPTVKNVCDRMGVSIKKDKLVLDVLTKYHKDNLKEDSSVKNRCIQNSLLNTIRNYQTFHNVRLRFDHLDRKFLKKVISGLNSGDISESGKPLLNSSVLVYIVYISKFIKWAEEEHYHDNKSYKDFNSIADSTLSSEPKSGVMPLESEVIKIWKADLGKLFKENARMFNFDMMEESRDLCVLQSQIGQRANRVMNLSSSSIKKSTIDGVELYYLVLLTKKSKKTTHVKLSKLALLVIDKRLRAVNPSLNNDEPAINQVNSDVKLFPNLFNAKSPTCRVNTYIRIISKALELDREHKTESIIGKDIVVEIKPFHEVISTHCFRGYFSTDYIMASARENIDPLMQLKGILGHSDIKTTMRYIRLNNDFLMKQQMGVDFGINSI